MPQRKINGVVVKFPSHIQNAHILTGHPQWFIKRAVDAVFMSVIRQTREIGSSKLAGLMTFRLKTTGSVRPKYWRNPATKIWHELPEKPARKTAFVKPTKKFKSLLN